MRLYIALLAALCSLTYVRSDEPALCRCALFVSTTYTEYMVYRLGDMSIDNCESHNQCMQRCISELNEDTSELDLWAMMGEDTVGQAFCSSLYKHHVYWIHNSKVHGYYEVCGGPWEYTGVDSQQLLCCNKGQHEHCIV